MSKGSGVGRAQTLDVAFLQRILISIELSEFGRKGPPAALEESRLKEILEESKEEYELTEEEARWVYSALIHRFAVQVQSSDVLVNNIDHEEWLVSSVKDDWKYWPRYYRWLVKKLPATVLKELDRSTDETLGLLESPNRPGDWDRRGLVVGHVQSGKTTHYAGLINKAADSGYKIIIVLAGLHNNLRSQTQIRLEEAFLGYSTDAFDTGSSIPFGVGTMETEDKALRPNTMTRRDEDGDFNKRTARTVTISPEETPWLFVVKKNTRVLRALREWLETVVADRGVIKDLPLLMIDDEADHGSIDTKQQERDAANGIFDEEHDPTKTNGLIREILGLFRQKSYVGYTATPFANIFIHSESYSKGFQSDLFPRSFIVNLKAPSNYFGPDVVFGNESEGKDALDGLIRIVDDLEGDSENEGWMPSSHKKSHRVLHEGEERLPPSLIEAVNIFLLATAVRAARGDAREHSSMLIHVSRFVGIQDSVARQVLAKIEEMKDSLRFNVDEDELMTRLQMLYENVFKADGERVVSQLSLDRDEYSWPVWDELKPLVRHVIGDVTVRQINGSAGDVLDYEAHRTTGLKVISIGGDKLARGLTLEGLCTSYFFRSAKSYDTLMQMGRWFGYRDGYKDLCRLYSSAELVDGFAHITKAAAELRQDLERMAVRKATPDRYGLKVERHPVLTVTARNKMRNAETIKLDLYGGNYETTTFLHSVDALEANFQAFTKLIRSLGPRRDDYAPPWATERSPKINADVWTSVRSEAVLNFFHEYRTSRSALRVNSNIIRTFIENKNERGELTDWTVVVVGGDAPPLMIPEELDIPVLRVGRTISSESEGVFRLKRVSQTRDESLDLTLEQYEYALEQERLVNERVGMRERRSEPWPLARFAREARGRGPNGEVDLSRGLLVLYVFKPEGDVAQRLNLAEKKPPVSFLVALPTSDSDESVEFAANSVMQDGFYD